MSIAPLLTTPVFVEQLALETGLMQRDVSFTSEELAFLAQEEEIQIVPQFTEDVVMAITGDFGPFIAGVPATVPLSVALRLKRDRQCAIVTPVWMRAGKSRPLQLCPCVVRYGAACGITASFPLRPSFFAANLQSVLRDEQSMPDKFFALPFHYTQTARLLLAGWCVRMSLPIGVC